MKVQAVTRRNVEDWRDSLRIEIDGTMVFCVWDGEPEDTNLSRNFNDCYKVVGLMRRAYEAGKRGESFSAEEKEQEVK